MQSRHCSHHPCTCTESEGHSIIIPPHERAVKDLRTGLDAITVWIRVQSPAKNWLSPDSMLWNAFGVRAQVGP